jgi:hypothetical protein
MRSSTYRLFACLAVVVFAGLPTAAAADEEDACVKLPDDLAVAGCSRAIDSRQYTGRSQEAQAYYNRGIAWEKKRRLRKALADFKMHSQLAPSDPEGPKAVQRVLKELSAR